VSREISRGDEKGGATGAKRSPESQPRQRRPIALLLVPVASPGTGAGRPGGSTLDRTRSCSRSRTRRTTAMTSIP
jgi:hypothetical protein